MRGLLPTTKRREQLCSIYFVKEYINMDDNPKWDNIAEDT